MADKKNRTCIVCGHNYRYCPDCIEFSNLPIWMNIFHDNNCREIYNAVSMYGKATNEDIKDRLDKCDLSNKDKFHKNIIKVIDELYPSVEIAVAVKEFVEKNIEVPIEEINEETNVEEISEISKEEYKSVRTYMPKKRK